MTTYRLGSNDLIHAPGILHWAMTGYAFKDDRPYLVNVITSGWGIPKAAVHALLSGKTQITIEESTVVFTH